MLKEDLHGGFTGQFAFEGSQFSFNVEGYGKPVVLTGSFSSKTSPYAWRFIFECLAGAYFVYSLDLARITGQDAHRDGCCSRLLLQFLKEIVGTEATIVSGRTEACSVVKTLRSSPEFARRAIILCPEGAKVVRARRSKIVVSELSPVKVPKALTAGIGRVHELPGMISPRRPDCGVCWRELAKSGALPAGKSPVRLCEDIIGFLG